MVRVHRVGDEDHGGRLYNSPAKIQSSTFADGRQSGVEATTEIVAVNLKGDPSTGAHFLPSLQSLYLLLVLSSLQKPCNLM